MCSERQMTVKGDAKVFGCRDHNHNPVCIAPVFAVMIRAVEALIF